MKNNNDWIVKNRSKVFNVQTLLNGLKSQAFKKYNGTSQTLVRFKGMSETEYRSINK